MRMTKAWTILCVVALLATGALGCNAHTRYRALCLLFDGVPAPPGEVPCDGNGNPLVPGKMTAKTAAEVARAYVQHGPYAARLCEGCHQRQTNKLLLPVTDLCLYCHVLSVKKKWIHGPVASGGCAVCHDAHGSGNPYLLVSKSQDFCLYCHRSEDVVKSGVHQASDASNCMTCHNAHASDNKYLLRESPGSPDQESPWGQPEQKQPDSKLARTAKAGDVSGPKNKLIPPGAPEKVTVDPQDAEDDEDNADIFNLKP
jgi:predicted CXXCH cytochrome family protein